MSQRILSVLAPWTTMSGRSDSQAHQSFHFRAISGKEGQKVRGSDRIAVRESCQDDRRESMRWVVSGMTAGWTAGILRPSDGIPRSRASKQSDPGNSTADVGTVLLGGIATARFCDDRLGRPPAQSCTACIRMFSYISCLPLRGLGSPFFRTSFSSSLKPIFFFSICLP